MVWVRLLDESALGFRVSLIGERLNTALGFNLAEMLKNFMTIFWKKGFFFIVTFILLFPKQKLQLEKIVMESESACNKVGNWLNCKSPYWEGKLTSL